MKLLQIVAFVTASLIACLAVIAAVVANTGEASGTVIAEICRKTPDGKWEIIDRAKAPIQCALNYSGAASNSTVASSSSWRWAATSEKGRQISASIPRPGKARFDATTGLLEMELPIEVTVDGKRERLLYKQTTESISTVIGTLSGKRATVTSDGFTAATVGFGVLRSRELINHLSGDSGTNLKDKKKAHRAVDELVVVLRSEGRAALKKEWLLNPIRRGTHVKPGLEKNRILNPDHRVDGRLGRRLYAKDQQKRRRFCQRNAAGCAGKNGQKQGEGKKQ